MSDVELKHCDLIGFSKLCAPEYNKPDFSDRVLVFDVMQEGWERTSLVLSSRSDEPDGASSYNGTVETNIISERSVEITDEEPERKRRKKMERGNETQVEFHGDHAEISATAHLGEEAKNDIEIRNEVENESDESTTSEPLTNDKAVKSPTQENWNVPLHQHKIYVHSLWLTVQSSYFRSLLRSSGMKESHCTEVHLKISESEENAHLFLLEAMYRSDVLNDKSVDELLAVLQLADKYDVKFVFKKCKYVLQKNATTFEVSTQIMHVIKVKHNMNDVEDLAATLQLVLAQEFNPLDENWQSEKFSNLSEPSLKYLLSSDDLIVQSENTVFHALMHWMELNEVDPAGLEETNDLLTVVRFKLVTIDYLYNVIKNHPIASKMPKLMELYLAGMTYHAIPPEQKKLLKDQPVLRKKPDEAICQYSFVIKKENFEKRNVDAKLKWDEFWACGYKMIVEGSCGFYNRFQPYLSVFNLNEESLVPLQFSIFAVTRGRPILQEACVNSTSYQAIHGEISFSSSDFDNDDQACKLRVSVKPL